MKAARFLALAMAVAVTAGASGCAMFNRGSLQYSRTTTIGKELVDLKDALDKGALTQDEYAKAKKDILSGGPLVLEESCKGK
ncbi:MAG: SHOCT domain-containing protein [bacterium]